MSNNKDNLYGVLGSGDVNPKIVMDGLLDVNGDDVTFLIHARRNPQGSVTTVYDFLADNEVPFVAYHRIDDNPPKALLSLADDSHKSEDPAKEIITALKRGNGTLLLLWDEKNPEHSEKLAVMAADAGVPMKDLSDGLAPIIVEGTSPIEEDEEELPIAPKPAKKEEKSLTAFTRDELMNMNIGVLRRQAKAIGIENIGRITKEEIVNMVLGGASPEVSADEHVPNPLQPLVGVMVYFDNGVMGMMPLAPEFVASALGRG